MGNINSDSLMYGGIALLCLGLTFMLLLLIASSKKRQRPGHQSQCC